jgi:hypothetical protein
MLHFRDMEADTKNAATIAVFATMSLIRQDRQFLSSTNSWKNVSALPEALP